MSNDLCEELLVEILSRLPTKSLLRFRSLSKSLCACIGSPSFIRLHTRRSPNKFMIIHKFPYHGESYPGEMYTLHSGGQLSCIGMRPVKSPFTSFSNIVGSCNGILCVYTYLNKGIHLWNPSMRRKVTIHSRPSLRNPEAQCCPLGFGFDPVIDDYKILTGHRCGTSKGFVEGTFVYTVKTDTWREIASHMALPYVSLEPCLFNEALHWVVKRFYYYILTFDLSSEVFSTIEPPEGSWEIEQVTIINGCLAVLSSKHDDIWIWVRSKTAACWSVAFKLNAHDHVGGVCRTTVFQLTSNDDLLFNQDRHLIKIYNPKTRKERAFVGLSGSWMRLLSTLCVESLGLIDMGTSCDERKHTTLKKREANKQYFSLYGK